MPESTIPLKKCDYCGKQFGLGIKPSALKKRHFCSQECAIVARSLRPKKQGELKTCEQCGKRFIARRSGKGVTRQQYCSNECKYKARHLPPTPCPICGTLFKSISRGINRPRRHCCSTACEYKFTHSTDEERQAIEAKNELDLLIYMEYPQNGAIQIAEKTGFDVKYVRNRAQTLGIRLDKDAWESVIHAKASANMKTNNPMKREEVRNKVRKWKLDHPEETRAVLAKSRQQSMRDKASKPELQLRDYLVELGIEHEHSAVIKDKFIVDFRIGKLIIQLDGEWWHGHPRFEPLSERQLKQRARDAAQDKYLTTCGYTVVRIWEHDLSIDRTRQIIEDHRSVI